MSEEIARTRGRSGGAGRGESGMNTPEYAVGTVAACGFASLMLLCAPWYDGLLRSILQVAVSQVKYLWPVLW